MELALAILMVLGIFVGIPAVIGFAIAGTHILRDRRAQRTRQVERLAGETVTSTTEALYEEPGETELPTAEPVSRTLVGAHRKR